MIRLSNRKDGEGNKLSKYEAALLILAALQTYFSLITMLDQVSRKNRR